MKECFDQMIENARAELRIVEETYLAHASQFDTQLVLRDGQTRQELQTFIAHVAELRAEWMRIPLAPHPEPATPIPHAANLVDPVPAPADDRPLLEPEDLKLPILQALVNMGGSGRTGIVIDAVGVLLQGRLGPRDLEAPGNNNEIRWRYYCRWARQTMVETGLLRDDSPHGTWEISEQGRAYLKNQTPLLRHM